MTSQPKSRNVSLSSRRINRSENHLKDIRNHTPLEAVDENGNNLFINRSLRQMDKFDLYSHMSETDLQKVGLLPSNFEDDEETIDANSSEEEDQVNDADSIPSEEDEKHQNDNESEEKSDEEEASSKLPILVKEEEKDIQENVEKTIQPKIEIKKKLTTPLVKNNAGNNKSNRRMTRNQRDEVFQQRLKLHIPTTEDDSELENLHKRIQMQTKNKKIQKSQLEVKRLQRNRLKSSVGSPDHDSTPYGSLASFATSVPSPRPLRWAFQQNKISDRYLSGQSSAFSLFSQDYNPLEQKYNPLEQRYNPLEQKYNRNRSQRINIDHSKPVTLKNLPKPSSLPESKLPKITFIAPTVTGKLNSSQRTAPKRTVWSSIRAWFTEFNRRYEGRTPAQKLIQDRKGPVFSPTFNEGTSLNSLMPDKSESRPVLNQPNKESSSVVWVDETKAENKQAKESDENRSVEINDEIKEDTKTEKINSNEQLNQTDNNSSNNIIINTEQAERFTSLTNLSNSAINSDKPDETNFSLLLPIPECGPLTTTNEVLSNNHIQISSVSSV